VIARPLILIGGGEHAAVVADAARMQDPVRVLAGFVDPCHPSSPAAGAGLPWLGGDEEGLRLARGGRHEFVIAVGAVGINPLRQRLAAGYEAAGARFATIIHPRAVISPSAIINPGSLIAANAVVNPRAEVGRHCVINTGAIVEHDVLIGDCAVLAPGAIVGGGVEVGAESFLGLGCRVRDHVRLGKKVLLAMGAVLVGDAPDGAVMKGVPARNLEVKRAARA
jgi:acetyltransferase EpsM